MKMRKQPSFVTQVLLVAAALSIAAASAWAGGGAENVFLVVNSADADSMAIANQFIDLRKIPGGSVFYVDWRDAPFDTDVATFRSRLLQPTIDAIKSRGLEEQIDYIIYSSGFPYRVDYSGDLSGVSRKWASLTSLTYLYEYVLSERYSMLEAPRANSYARNLLAGSDGSTRGFRHRYGIDLMGERVESDTSHGQHYYLSMMLGYTKGAGGNTINEVMRYLLFAQQADFKRPKGTIYFVKQNDVRSTTRHMHFPSVVEDLAKLGVKGEELQGGKGPVAVLPRNKSDVLGAVVGYAKARWEDTKSRVLPGAIIENLTSYGGRLQGNHSQVMLTHFLRQGAVASSGTVTEPYANIAKFPHPRMHVHYAGGCSVAEAFYQSVASPYQLLIVGDPLCQPWAVPPEVKISGLDTRRKLTGKIEFDATATSQSGNKIRSLEFYVDGRLMKRVVPGEKITFNTARISNGFHEFRVVAIEDTPIETQGRVISAFVTENSPRAVSDEVESANARKRSELATSIGVSSEVVPNGYLRQGQNAYVKVSSRNAAEIRVYRGREVIGAIKGDSGRILLDTTKLGGGPVQFQAVAFPKNQSLKAIIGVPMNVVVEIRR